MNERNLTAVGIRQIREYCEHRDLSEEDLKLFISQLIHDLELERAEVEDLRRIIKKDRANRMGYYDG